MTDVQPRGLASAAQPGGQREERVLHRWRNFVPAFRLQIEESGAGDHGPDLSMLLLRILLAMGLTVVGARATTVIAPSFDELVGQSELVFRGHVTAVRSISHRSGGKTAISTEVTFAVERTLRGSAGERITLEFLGGEVGGKRLHLVGWPRFSVGERGIFFVEDRTGQVCPLMRLGHGRYRIASDATAGTEHVFREDFTALRSAEDVSRPITEAGAPRSPLVASAALSVPAFEALVLERSAALGAPLRPQ